MPLEALPDKTSAKWGHAERPATVPVNPSGRIRGSGRIGRPGVWRALCLLPMVDVVLMESGLQAISVGGTAP
jgi:hypothetical protein